MTIRGGRVRRGLFERLASDDDELVAGFAAWARDTRIALSDYTEMR